MAEEIKEKKKFPTVKGLQKEVDEMKSTLNEIKDFLVKKEEEKPVEPVAETVPVAETADVKKEKVIKMTQAEKDAKAIEDAPEGLRKIVAEELSAKLGGIFKIGVRERENDSFNYDVDIFVPDELAEVKGKRDCRSITINKLKGDTEIRRQCIRIRKHIANKLMNEGKLVDDNLRNEVMLMKTQAFAVNK